MNGKSRTQVKLFEKTYEISSTEEDIPALLEAAKVLEEQLLELHGQDNRKPPDIEKLAVTNSLNLIHDLNRLDSLVAKLADRTTEMVQRLESGSSLELKR